MRTKRAIALLAGCSTVAFCHLAHAEAGVPYCSNSQLVELFAGTEDCPAAQYAVIRTSPWGLDEGMDVLTTTDRCNDSIGQFGTWTVSSTGTQEQLLLVGTAQAAELFGIQLDVEAASPTLPLEGMVQITCDFEPSELVAYGGHPSSFAPAIEPGRALTRTPSGWELGDPKPVNANGDEGVLGACSAASQQIPRVDQGPTCPSPEAGTDAEAGQDADVEQDAAAGPDADPGQDASAGPDAGAGPSADSDSESDGCSCRAGRAVGAWHGAMALCLVLLGVCFRRRSPSVPPRRLG